MSKRFELGQLVATAGVHAMKEETPNSETLSMIRL